MSIETERLVNGLLKGFGGDLSPDQVNALLTQDVEIVAPPSRAHSHDLWPAIWALAAILERQVFGHVFIRCGLAKPLPAPSALGPQCRFVDSPQPVSLSLHLGTNSDPAHSDAITGDAHGGLIGSSILADTGTPPSPIECFMLAGFLGFAAIARLVGIPDNKKDYTQPRLQLALDSRALARALDAADGYTCIGLGQVGQAFLALLFFLYGGDLGGRRFALIDDDAFQRENGRTQLLLAAGANWIRKDKVAYVESVVTAWRAAVVPLKEKIGWTWRRGSAHPRLALLGLHDLEGRRIASAAGFDHLIEAGVGTDLLQPRITWHSFGGDGATGHRLFAERPRAPARGDGIQAKWADELRSTAGGCGWVEFLGASATAPCLGTAAAAFALAEFGGPDAVISGAALLWSQYLPAVRHMTAQL